MAVYNVHAGHCPQGKGASGAVGILKESVEDRLVKNEVITMLKAQGHTAYDCTCEDNTDQDTCLARIVKKCNAHNVDYDISIHLNSGRNDYKGDKSTGGVEVWNYDDGTKEISDKICANVSSALGIRNRGTKYDSGLYVLANTKAPAMLVECCFVDDKDDADKWDYKKCAAAIVEGLTGKAVSSSSSGSSNAYHGGTPGKYWATVQLYSPNQTDAQKWIVHKHSDGKYSIKNKACSLYLDVKSAKTTNETPIQVYSWNNTKAQRFELEIGGADGVGEETVIRSVLDRNMAVDVKEAGTANGTKIQLYKFNDSSAQKWNFVPAGGEDEYYIINSVSGKALDVKGGGK